MPKLTAITVDPQSPAFDSADAAASAIAAKFESKSGAETAAMLFRDETGKFRYSTTVPGNADHFALAAQIPKGSSLAAIVHSHPGDDSLGQMFSPDDLSIADRLKLPSYIRFLKDGAVRKYVPGVTKTTSVPSPGNAISVRAAFGDPLPTTGLMAGPPTPTGGLLAQK